MTARVPTGATARGRARLCERRGAVANKNPGTHSHLVFLSDENVRTRVGRDYFIKKIVLTYECLDFFTSEYVWTHVSQSRFCAAATEKSTSPKNNFLLVGNSIREFSI